MKSEQAVLPNPCLEEEEEEGCEIHRQHPLALLMTLLELHRTNQSASGVLWKYSGLMGNDYYTRRFVFHTGGVKMDDTALLR
jgi:hypothetical protein